MLLVALLLLPAAGCPFRAKKMQFMCELQTTLRELMRKNEEYRLQVWLLLLLLVLEQLPGVLLPLLGLAGRGSASRGSLGGRHLPGGASSTPTPTPPGGLTFANPKAAFSKVRA